MKYSRCCRRTSIADSARIPDDLRLPVAQAGDECWWLADGFHGYGYGDQLGGQT
jgi:hypothetical protein